MCLLFEVCKILDKELKTKLIESEHYDGIIYKGNDENLSLEIGVKALLAEEKKKDGDQKICIQSTKFSGDLLEFDNIFESILTHPAIQAVFWTDVTK